MTEALYKQTDRELAALLRAVQRSGAIRLEAEELAALAEGRVDAVRRDALLAVLAESPADADLVKLLRELAPESEQIAAAASGRRANARGHRRTAAGASHRRHVPRRRAAMGLAGAGMAAALVCALGIAVWQESGPAPMSPAATAATAEVDDSIFHARMDGARTARNVTQGEDRIFSAGMHGGPAEDEIFHAGFKRQG